MAQADPDARQIEAGWSALGRNDLPGAERIARRLLEKDPLESQVPASVLQLAANPARLSALRARLVANRMTAPLFDTDRFRRHLEAAYLQMLESRGAP